MLVPVSIFSGHACLLPVEQRKYFDMGVREGFDSSLCLTLGKKPNLLETPFPCLKNSDNNISVFPEDPWKKRWPFLHLNGSQPSFRSICHRTKLPRLKN